MASAFLRLLFSLIIFVGNPNPTLSTAAGSVEEEYSVLSTWHDYSPPSPPPPPAGPTPPSVSCEDDLAGTGSFKTLCQLSSDLNLTKNVYIEGPGSLALNPEVVISCAIPGCLFIANLTGEIRIGRGAKIIAGMVELVASNMTFAEESVLNTTALAGDPPPQTSGTPSGINGDGGGHGGRGASCIVKEGQTAEDSWGGDAYSWTSLMRPNSYGSKGGTTSRETDYGGGGGGVIWLIVKDVLAIDGNLTADGGNGGVKGGGGSGGSIYIVCNKL